MSDYKDKVTKGPWSIGNLGIAAIDVKTGITTVARVLIGGGEGEANAQLIAEAGTVLHETGMTPRELAEQRAELLAALKAIVGCWQSVCAGQKWEPDHVTEATNATAAIARCEAAQ